VNLGELALTCFAYGAMNADDSLAQFERRVDGRPDLWNQEHRQALLHWLNQWQCRQFSLAYHDLASDGLLEWHREFGGVLPPVRDHLWQVPEATLEDYAEMFDALAKKVACYRDSGRAAPAGAPGAAPIPGEAATPIVRRLTVTFGPTAAAKILFVLRPRVFVAWDEPIRAQLHADGSGRSYADFLLRLREELLYLQEQCHAFDLDLEELPAAMGRPLSTPAQLLDEYYWATRTRSVVAPPRRQVAQWLEWYTPPTPEQPTLVIGPTEPAAGAGDAAPRSGKRPTVASGGATSKTGGGASAKPVSAGGRPLVPPPVEPSATQ
jgi:hypothetical protein